jgi:glycerol transport system ATP-binding protein
MTVGQNLAFPLRNSGVPPGESRARVAEIACLLELDSVLDHGAAHLTDAEKQKVSLGRGIVRKDTAAVLLDEPLTVIDPQARWELRRKLKEVQKELKMTMIYVTHDQHEALTFADQVTVMNQGKVLQTADPRTLYESSSHPFVAHFIGSPGMNLFRARRETAGWRLSRELCLAGLEGAPEAAVGAERVLGIRPEYLEIHAQPGSDQPAAEITVVEDQGATRVLTLETENLKFKARTRTHARLTEGDRVGFRFAPAKIRWFELDSSILPILAEKARAD